MPKLALAGTELNYERAGEGEPLLLIQGMSANRLAWGQPFSSLLEERFEVISFDNRGMGLSSPVAEAFSIAEMAADTAAILDALELESAHVLGISMGGMIAQELALAYPERIRSLTLGATYCGGPEGTLMSREDLGLLAAAMATGEREPVFRAMWEINLSPAFRADEARFERFCEMGSALPAPKEVILQQMKACAAHDTSARLAPSTVPTQVIHGTVDPLVRPEGGKDTAASIPGAKLMMIDGMGHAIPIPMWPQIVDAIDQHAHGATKARH